MMNAVHAPGVMAAVFFGSGFAASGAVTISAAESVPSELEGPSFEWPEAHGGVELRWLFDR